MMTTRTKKTTTKTKSKPSSENRTNVDAERSGLWLVEITDYLSDLVAQSITLSEARFDGEEVYWLEGRPQELGRLVVVRADARVGHGTDVTPKFYNARTRVHEYGGASWTVANGDVYFSNFADGRLYRQPNHSSHPIPLTAALGVLECQ